MKVKAKIRTYALVAIDTATGETADPLTHIPFFMYMANGSPIIAHTEEALKVYLQGEGAENLGIRQIGEAEITLTLDDQELKKLLK